MSAFAALMALSASQTKEAQSAVQTVLEQRQRNEELRRKKQEEIDRKMREEEAKLRQKRLEDERREREREAQREAARVRQEADQVRREEEARHALLYGPKKAKQPGLKWPTSHSGIKEEVRRRVGAGGDDDDGEGELGMALTREEKRQRRMQAEMKRTYQLKRASSSSGGYTKAGRRLPGGAIDAPSAPTSDSGASAQSVKARLAALPNTLTKLNVNKRDTRTIDEILQDRARAKNAVLDGEDAREFNDWFGKSKKKSSSATVSNAVSSGSLGSGSSSGANSPRLGTQSASQLPAKSGTNGKTPSGVRSSRPVPNGKSSASTIPKYPTKLPPSKSPVPRSSRTGAPGGSASASSSSLSSSSKKRPRSPSFSLSPSPPPPKRRAPEPERALGSEIWKLFGKDRSSYVARDVLSDDEDMEADVGDVMKEEMRSARLAKREDEMAFEEEKRHEEEKRRRKREREMRERQGI